MAVDEALALLWREGESLPVLRVYQWSSPTLSIGYGQRECSNINISFLRERSIPLIRRVTGGRGVLHRDELTYSVISGRAGFFPDSISGTNRLIQSAVLDGLMEVGVPARQVRSETRGVGDACFSASSFHEISVEGKKISGSAQRRLKKSFVQHGSILFSSEIEMLVNCFKYPSPGKKEEYLNFLKTRMTGVNEVKKSPVSFNELRDAIINGACFRFNSRFIPSALSDHEKELVLRLEKEKREESMKLVLP